MHFRTKTGKAEAATCPSYERKETYLSPYFCAAIKIAFWIASALQGLARSPCPWDVQRYLFTRESSKDHHASKHRKPPDNAAEWKEK